MFEKIMRVARCFSLLFYFLILKFQHGIRAIGLEGRCDSNEIHRSLIRVCVIPMRFTDFVRSFRNSVLTERYMARS